MGLSSRLASVIGNPCRDKSKQKKLAASLKDLNDKFADHLRKLAQ